MRYVDTLIIQVASECWAASSPAAMSGLNVFLDDCLGSRNKRGSEEEMF